MNRCVLGVVRCKPGPILAGINGDRHLRGKLALSLNPSPTGEGLLSPSPVGEGVGG
ncbi:hypothetical protein PJF56_16185 [Roseofilum sp. BLCC_M91]|uniref:Uncharacterized protein n=1 Tax=Roseofilum halophilum BLCC-M91 TaxID=3022259 RepID=A0ABT7BMH1_9CYAN|nr:hypothetical protein [Roseofilum halophilum]MDJ1180402.1 hypothetical protein [Roseofilum halophilum BLCC-M91]